MENRIDSHCHLFNKDMLTPRIIILLMEAVANALRKHQKKINKTSRDYLALLEELRNAIDFLKAGWEENSTAVYQTMQESYTSVYGDNVISTPLTFDLLYCFKGSVKLLKGKTMAETGLSKHAGRMQSEWDKLIRSMKNIQDELHPDKNILHLAEHEKVNGFLIHNQWGSLIETARTLFRKLMEHQSKIDWDKSFHEQLDEMQALRANHRDTVFPFLVADPRRPGIVDMVKKNVDGEHYFGVKVYAPNGYSPTDPTMKQIYAFCAGKGIPITAHCSHAGFATFENTIEIHGLMNHPQKGIVEWDGDYTFDVPFLQKNWVQCRAEALNNPKLWEKVLEEFPGLKLNLAHFGNSDDGYEWTQLIYGMMAEKSNLYTDFSCVTDRTKLITFKQLFWDKASPEVRARFLYGSDFYLNLVFIRSFNDYLQQFKEVFSPEELQQIAWDNPLGFHQIPVNKVI